MSVTCQICKREFKSLHSLSCHISATKRITLKEYYDKFLRKNNDGRCKYCGKGTTFINLVKGYHDYCSAACSNKSPETKEKKKQTCLKNYGTLHPSQSEEVKEKTRETVKQRYGVDYPMQSKVILEKAKQTCLKNYGVLRPSQSEKLRKKAEETMLQRYGVRSAMQSKLIRDKAKQTCLQRYGVDSVMKCQQIKSKVQETFKKRYGVTNPVKNPEVQKKIRETCLKRYGVENVFQSEEIKEKIKRTNLQKYGVENPAQNQEVQEKMKATMVKIYGVEHPMHSPDVKAKLRQKQRVKFLKKLNEYLDHLGLELLDPVYEHAHFAHTWKCKKCGTLFTKDWNTIQQGYSCPSCREVIRSKGEDELAGFLKSLHLDISQRNRKIIPPLELDIVIPEKKIAIEYNGLYWHNEEFVGKDYHLQKTEACEKIGYRLIHIFEDEWIFKKDIVKSRLKHILGKTEDLTHIGARECTIKEISIQEKNNFLEQYHIQGPDVSKIKLGAFYQDQLVAVMTFSHGSLAKGVKHQDSLIWELNRFCIHPDFVISGIASKLLEHFKKNYEWKEIYSYADRRWSDGNLYKQLGFELEHTTEPNYWYVRDFERIHRFNLRKRPNEPKDIPEHILRLKEGYVRVWDCGNLKFTLTHQQSS